MRMSILLTALYFASLSLSAQSQSRIETSARATFRFHSGQEPIAIDPAALGEATGGFLFYNLYRSLVRLNADGQPQPELAKQCYWLKPGLKLRCVLRDDARFSDGTPITSTSIKNAWLRLLDPATRSRHAELLLGIQGARERLLNEGPADRVAIRDPDAKTLDVELVEPDLHFLLKLANPILTPLAQTPPTKPEDFAKIITTGPYTVQEWSRGTRILLAPNPHYPGAKNRPNVEVLIINEDQTALQLYDLGKLDFLRRLTVKAIPARRSGKDFHFIPTLRFDYIGFGPELSDSPDLRKALAMSLNYEELTKAYLTPGKIGCPSLPRDFAEPWPCHNFDLKSARAAWDRLPPEIKSRKLTLVYSSAGGEDVNRGMEWMQNQWRKHLNADIQLEPLETAMFLQRLRSSPPSLFRKGVNLSQPHCLAALENFLPDAAENFIRFKDARLEKVIKDLKSTTSPVKTRKLCGKGLSILINGYQLIPLGELYFAMLARDTFTGWRVTRLNQLDLTDLRPTRPN